MSVKCARCRARQVTDNELWSRMNDQIRRSRAKGSSTIDAAFDAVQIDGDGCVVWACTFPLESTVRDTLRMLSDGYRFSR